MIQELYQDPRRVRHLLSGPLGTHIDAFIAIERDEGFARLSIRDHLRALGKLNRWFERRRLSASALTADLINAFIRERRRRERPLRDGRDVLRRFLQHLQTSGVTPPARQKRRLSELERLIEDYGEYLTRQRGLSHWTVTRYTYLVRPLLKKRFGSGKIRLGQLRPADVHAWIVDTAQTHGRGRARALVPALRTFLRWLRARGDVRGDLASAVPSVAAWRLRGVPPILNPSDVERVLRTCDRQTDMGRRDYAILLLLARLGLRAAEVVSLGLSDLDWREGVLRVRRKGGVIDQLPIPPEVGNALAAYIKRGRPTCGVRRVFLCTVAPHRGLGHSNVVSSIVAAALKRAGLAPAMRGAHLLRHTLASSLLRRGATMSDIGQLLGHRSPESTEVYAKVDINGLRTVAHPWPGGRR